MNDTGIHYTWFDAFVIFLTMVLFLLSGTFELAGIAFIFSFIIFIFFCI